MLNACLVLVDDGVPRRTIDLLLAAAVRQGVTTDVVKTSQFTFANTSRLTAGEMLYRPAVSSAAARVERFLFAPGVSSFYLNDDAPYFDDGEQQALFARAGIPTLPMMYITSRRRATLDTVVEQLGGYPLVAKVPGGEGGVGVLQLDSSAALYSFVDFVLGGGHTVQLMTFIPNATHIRAVVVGDRIVGSYRNPIDRNDFRTTPSTDLSDYGLSFSDELTALAVAATHTNGSAFGGVDLLLDADSKPYILEVNFPCFHPQAEVVGGMPVSDAMVRFLIDKRSRLQGMAA